MATKRDVAYKCIIKDLVSADYVQNQTPHPSYVSLYGKRVRRVNIIGIAVQVRKHDIVIDDGTGSIVIKVFTDETATQDFKIGTVVQCVGRPRAHNGGILLGAEIVSILDSDKWIEARKHEIERLYTREKNGADAEVPETVVNTSQILLQTIEELDNTSGAPVDRVIQKSEVEDAEEQIEALINEGEIYEVKPGYVKIL